MFILILFISCFNLQALHTYDTTIAPRKTITALEVAANNQGQLVYENNLPIPNPKFVLELANARVYEDGHIITYDNFLLEDTVIKYPEKPLSEYHMLHRNELPKAHHFKGKLAIIASPGSQCYYHWMFQILPRLKILKDLHIEYDALYIEPLSHPFQLETLAKIGIDNKKIVFAKPNSQIIADVLLVPSIAIKEPSFAFPQWVIDFLRSEFLDATNLEKYKNSKKIYISRSKAASRRIVNEGEVIKFLESQEFTTVHLEDYSLLEQAAIIASANTIISPHGSGLSNLVFADKGAQVIEIFNQEGFNKLFYNLSQSAELQHHALICTDEELTWEQQQNEDIVVDIPRLKSLINSI